MIECFVEKGAQGSSLISSGWCIYDCAIKYCLPKSLSASLEHNIFSKIAEGGKFFGYYDDGQWFDAGTAEVLEEMEHKWRT